MAAVVEGLPHFSLSEVSTHGASFGEDVRAYAEAGADGIGVWELKLGTIGSEAERAGGRIAFEPFQREGVEEWSIANTLDDAAGLIDEAGSPALGIQFDVWHQWNVPAFADDIARQAHRPADVHVNDWREPTRGGVDRVLPGEGVAGMPAILEDAGWHGFCDLEIFSDDGAFGAVYPDALWDLPPAELVRRACAAFADEWERRR